MADTVQADIQAKRARSLIAARSPNNTGTPHRRRRQLARCLDNAGVGSLRKNNAFRVALEFAEKFFDECHDRVYFGPISYARHPLVGRDWEKTFLHNISFEGFPRGVIWEGSGSALFSNGRLRAEGVKPICVELIVGCRKIRGVNLKSPQLSAHPHEPPIYICR